MAQADDTIFALSSAPGRAGVAVVRMTGPGAGPALASLTQRPEILPRSATLTNLYNIKANKLDRGLVLWFPAPASFTGEDMAELQIHGGRAVVAAVLEALSAFPGLRPAEPGEFTRRAFDHGKLDLSEVEGLSDLIAAETEAQRRQALDQMAGGLSRLIEGWRARLVGALARVEASIDFAEEGVPADLAQLVRGELAPISAELSLALADAGRGERLRQGLQVAILGPPNAGKSSLINALAQRDAAIVSDQPGTTRDVIEVHLDLAGYPLTLADTAGLRDPAERDVGPVETEGLRRAYARAAGADLKLIVLDGQTWPEPDPASLALVDDRSLVLLNKADLGLRQSVPESIAGRPCLVISALTGQGLDGLLGQLETEAVARLSDAAVEAPVITRLRHRAALVDCGAALERAAQETEAELLAEELRLAVRALGRITGRVDVEDLLDLIFAEFCIGK